MLCFCGHSVVLGQSPLFPTQHLVIDHEICQLDHFLPSIWLQIMIHANQNDGFLNLVIFQNKGWKGEIPSLKGGGNGQGGDRTDVMCKCVGAYMGACVCGVGVHICAAVGGRGMSIHCCIYMHIEARSWLLFLSTLVLEQVLSMNQKLISWLGLIGQEAHRTRLSLPHGWCLIRDECYLPRLSFGY